MKPVTFPGGLGGLVAVAVILLCVLFAVLHMLPILVAVLIGLLAVAILLP